MKLPGSHSDTTDQNLFPIPYLTIIRDSLEQALCLKNFPSQLYEKINRPQVEVRESLELINKPIIISRNESEKVEIETSINSVRVNVAVKKYQEIDKLIVDIYSKYLMNRANQLNVLRKVAKPGYDISFLITNFTLENYKKEDIIDFIVEFIQDFTKEVTEMKMTVNSQSRFATTYLMEQVKV
jgi:actin related protein 2/3 complex subunit 4